MSEQRAKVLAEILAERERQMQVERFGPEHDDRHDNGDLSLAASCYAQEAAYQAYHHTTSGASPPLRWPWASDWWKPKDPRRNLIRAAALIVAEIERLDRRG